MEKQLPKNWVETKLGEITSKPQYGWTSKAGNNGKIKYLRTTDLSKGKVNWASVPYCIEIPDDISKYQVEKNDILISRAGSVGLSYRIEQCPEKAVFASYLIRFKPLINAKLIEYFLQSSVYWNAISDVSAGIAVQNINAPKLSNLKFPLPPLAEQNRIVAKLDTLFAQLEIIKTSMATIPVLLKNFRQQVLTQAVTGKLTESWRVGKELKNEFTNRIVNSNKRISNINLPDTWLDLSFDSVVVIKSNLVPPNEYLEYPLITPDVIQSETGILLSKPLVSDILPISAKHYFSNGDIIYSKIRPYLSKLIIADFDGLCSADMYPISTDLNIKFLFYFMLSNEFLVFATTAGERSVLPKINQKGLNVIPIPTPSLVEQQEIVSRVESLFAKADAIEKQYQTLKEKIDNLPQAILHKAFKGELTEQLDSDGDAKELLKEIEALKATAGKKLLKIPTLRTFAP